MDTRRGTSIACGRLVGKHHLDSRKRALAQSMKVPVTSTACMQQVGTPLYQAPEVMAGLPYGSKADVFSFGVLLYVLVTGVGGL